MEVESFFFFTQAFISWFLWVMNRLVWSVVASRLLWRVRYYLRDLVIRRWHWWGWKLEEASKGLIHNSCPKWCWQLVKILPFSPHRPPTSAAWVSVWYSECELSPDIQSRELRWKLQCLLYLSLGVTEYYFHSINLLCGIQCSCYLIDLPCILSDILLLHAIQVLERYFFDPVKI